MILLVKDWGGEGCVARRPFPQDRIVLLIGCGTRQDKA